MSWKRATRGERLRFPASLYNRLIDLASSQPRGRVGGVAASSLGSPAMSATTALAHNPTAIDLPAAGVARATDFAVDPDERLRVFLSRPVLAIEPATDANADAPLVVAVDRIPAGGLGLVAIAGVVPARLVVVSEDHRHASPSTSTPWELRSSESGSTLIGKSAGLGLGWCYLLLAASSSPPANSGRVAVILESEPIAGGVGYLYRCAWVENPSDRFEDWTFDPIPANGVEARNLVERATFTAFEPLPIRSGVGVILFPLGDQYAFTLAQVEGECLS